MDSETLQSSGSDLETIVQSDWVLTAITMLAIIAVTALVSYLATSLIKKLVHKTHSDFIPSTSIFLNIVRGIIWFSGFSAILAICFGVDISAAIAALGIGGIALSLGLQDTISNLIGGLQVSFLKVIEPGNNIQVDDRKGVVADIAWRNTTLISPIGEKIVIPNSVINNRPLIHLSPATLVVANFVIRPNEKTLDEISESMVEACLNSLKGNCAPVDTPDVSFSEISEFGIKGYLYFHVADAADNRAARSLAIEAIAPLSGLVGAKPSS